MKITLYTPGGPAETFKDCDIVEDGTGYLFFKGTDGKGNVVKRLTSLPFTIDPGSAEESLASSPFTE